jgi:hypothetical protein
VICQSCRDAGNTAAGKDHTANVTGPPLPRQAELLHVQCPEVRRHHLGLTAVELAGSSWCDCQHVLPARPVPVREPAPTLD